MGDTSIEWTHGNDGKRGATWNPLAGCSMCSPGCARCYAETMGKRLRAMALADIARGKDPGRKRVYLEVIGDNGRWTGKLVPIEEALTIPLRAKKPTTWFVNSMSDLFHEGVPFEFVDRVFAVMALTPQHTYQILTKRPERMAEYLAGYDRGRQSVISKAMVDEWGFWESKNAPGAAWNVRSKAWWPLPNVWLGASVEDQKRADERIPRLLRCPAAVRFLSCEPLLEDLRLAKHLEQTVYCTRCHGSGFVDGTADGCRHCCGSGIDRVDRKIDWVIVGGESGANARPFDVGWARNIVRQCREAELPCFVKQLGSHPVEPVPGMEATREVNAPFMGSGWRHWRLKDPKGGDMTEWPEDLRVRQFPRREVSHA